MVGVLQRILALTATIRHNNATGQAVKRVDGEPWCNCADH
jgi:hypothetical protein